MVPVPTPMIYLYSLPSNFLSSPIHSTLELRGGLRQVTTVVNPHELGRSTERLREQMRKLELSPQEGKTPWHLLLVQNLSNSIEPLSSYRDWE